MDPETKARWVEALRSGKYTQTTRCLRDGTGFCCIGVLADVVGVEWEKQVWQDGEAFFEMGGDEPVRAVGVPVPTQAALVAMNDHGKSFAEIADYIEANL